MDDRIETWTDRFLDHLRIERNSSAHTVKSYAEDLSAVREFLGQRAGKLPTLADLTTKQIRTMTATWHESGYAASSVSRRLSSLRSFCRFLCRHEAIERNPTEGLRGPKGARKLPRFYTDAQIEALLNAPPKDGPMGLRDRALLETCYAGGLRVSELVGLDVEDVDLDEGVLRVRGKGKREGTC